MSRTITFVLQPPIWASQREKELRLAEIRSHATKVTSARIKQKRRAIQLVPPQTKTVYAPSPGSVLDEKDLDPFNSAAIPVTPLVKWSIEHWERIYVFTLVQPMTSAAVNLPALHAWNQEIKRIIGEEMILHGAYAGALGYLLTHSNVAGRYKKLREQYLFHSGQCVSLIQRKLIAGHVSERTILAVWFAGCSSFAELDMKTCRMHFQGAKQLTDFLGGLQALRSWSLKVLLIVMDLIAAGIVLERTYFPVATWGTGPWQEQSRSNFDQYRFNKLYRSQYPNQSAELPESLKDHLRQWRELLVATALARESSHQTNMVTDEIYSWVHFRRYSLVAMTLDLYHDILELHRLLPVSDIQRNLELSLCLAISYAARMINDPGIENVGDYIAFPHLKPPLSRLLRQMAETCDWSYVNTVLWMLFVGSCYEEITSKIQTSETRWFSSRMMRLATEMGRKQLTEGFQLFVHDDEVLGVFLAALLEKKEELLEYNPSWTT